MELNPSPQFPTQEENIRETKSTDTKPHQFSVTILKPAEQIYAFWRDFQNLPLFMKDLESIQNISETRSHWKMKLKTGLEAEWDAEIIEEIPGHKISWKSLEGSSVLTEGTVWFEEASAKRGCVVRLVMSYKIPGGKLSELAGKFTGEDPYNLTLTNLRRLKALLETGEIPTTEGQPSGRDEDSREEPTLH